jgi:hypothetical protein
MWYARHHSAAKINPSRSREYLRTNHPHDFKKFLDKGYMEPVPTSWILAGRLAYPYPEFSNYENEAEERLYYLLNNGVMPDGTRSPHIEPLNVK